jgi:M6 family metalloprotease-like protein
VERPARLWVAATIVTGLVVAGSAWASSGAEPAPPCAAPALGFGAGEGSNAPELPPTVGDLRIGMLFVDFSDSPGTISPQTIFDTYVPRVVEWYRTVSYGGLRIDVRPLPRWLRLPRTLAEYQQERFDGAVEAAVAAANDSFDFSDFDALYVVPSMPALASTIIDDVPLRVDGAEIHSWAWLATGSLQRLPLVAVHETGHLLGLPDLYNERVPSSQHRWDVMTAAPGGGGMLAWHRWKLGWLQAGQITCLRKRGTISARLTSIEEGDGTKVLVSRMGAAAVVVEVRRAVAEDAALCKVGVLVYRVDFKAGAPENAGARGLPIQLRPARKDDPRRWGSCGREWRAPFDLGRGQVSRTTAWGHRITVLRAFSDGSYRVRMTRK